MFETHGLFRDFIGHRCTCSAIEVLVVCSRCRLKFKGNSHPKLSVANMIELLLKSILVCHSPMLEAWKAPERLVEVLCDITQHLVAYRTAIGTRTNSSGMRSHTGRHSQLPCMPTLIFAGLVHSV